MPVSLVILDSSLQLTLTIKGESGQVPRLLHFCCSYDIRIHYLSLLFCSLGYWAACWGDLTFCVVYVRAVRTDLLTGSPQCDSYCIYMSDFMNEHLKCESSALSFQRLLCPAYSNKPDGEILGWGSDPRPRDFLGKWCLLNHPDIHPSSLIENSLGFASSHLLEYLQLSMILWILHFHCVWFLEWHLPNLGVPKI